jgi:sRNA-binding protein
MDQQLDKIRAYIEKHDLQGKVSAAVTKCVQTLPEDPNAFLASCFAEASPKKAAPAKPVAGPAAETAAMLFAKADANHDGVLSKSEIKKFLKNQEPSLKKTFGVAEGGWESLWTACDMDGDKSISLEEWKALYTSKVGGAAAAGGDAKESKKQSKKEKKEAKKKGGKEEKAADPEADAKAAAKKVKAVEKEGGKKGVEIEGAADMGGLAFFCTTLMEPDGDLELLEKAFSAMNAIPNPDPEEERRGGAGGVGKMVFSAGVERLAIISNMPEELQVDKKMDDAPTREAMAADKWVQEVLDSFAKECPGLKVEAGSNASFAKAFIPSNKEKGFFPLKFKDDAMSSAYGILQRKHCMNLSDSSEGECFGDFAGDDY